LIGKNKPGSTSYLPACYARNVALADERHSNYPLNKQIISKDAFSYSNTRVTNNVALGVPSIILIISSYGIPKRIRIKLPRHKSSV